MRVMDDRKDAETNVFSESDRWRAYQRITLSRIFLGSGSKISIFLIGLPNRKREEGIEIHQFMKRRDFSVQKAHAVFSIVCHEYVKRINFYTLSRIVSN